MATRGIRLRWFQSKWRMNLIDGVRIRIEADCAVGMTDKVFAYRMLLKNPHTGTVEGHFSHICSPADIHEFPEDEPRVGYAPEWFRLNYVDVFIRAENVELLNFIELVRADVRSLKHSLDIADVLLDGGEELIGDECAPESDSSTSSDGPSEGSSESLGAPQLLCTHGTSELSVGSGVAWTNVREGAGQPASEDSSMGAARSQVILTANQVSQLLLVQGFDFHEIPDDAIIEGISATLAIRDATHDSDGSLPNDCPYLTMVALQHPTLGLSQNQAQADCLPGPDWQDTDYGGTEDLWGYESVTGADMKQGSFGLSIIVVNPAGVEYSRIEVDEVRICVTYRNVY